MLWPLLPALVTFGLWFLVLWADETARDSEDQVDAVELLDGWEVIHL